MENISLLLGAGFSKPANYPLASEINLKFRDLSLAEFFIHTSESAHLTDTQNPNWIITQEKHYFVVDFIQFYCSVILSDQKDFHYETFFDYYMQLMKREPNENEKFFFEEFKRNRNYNWDHHQLLFQFNRTFQQLVADYITVEWPKSISYLTPYSTRFPHKNYLELLEYLGEEHKVHIHTLNHDLLMEKYFHFESIAGKTSDGFDDFASPYYGQISNKDITQRIRLKRFINRYDAIFNLYKLHGSVDNYIFNTNNKVYEMIKWEYGLLERGIVKEITTHLGEHLYFDGYVDVVPEFLSGTTEKIKHYERKVYYSKIFERFKNNLITSNYLIVIGYGFGDSKINKFLSDCFINNDNQTMIVINKTRPDSVLIDKKT
ncbi:hypothetical protein BMS3Abin03_02826 [bacterium BMS3Abin03]|nr:hypothetical protein BMS3Abin03_02826 [bacterium BMS3Abin03]